MIRGNNGIFSVALFLQIMQHIQTCIVRICMLSLKNTTAGTIKSTAKQFKTLKMEVVFFFFDYSTGADHLAEIKPYASFSEIVTLGYLKLVSYWGHILHLMFLKQTLFLATFLQVCTLMSVKVNTFRFICVCVCVRAADANQLCFGATRLLLKVGVRFVWLQHQN